MTLMDQLQVKRNSEPPRLVIYSPPGLGKTTLASEAPGAVFLQTEEGIPTGIEVTAFPLIEDIKNANGFPVPGSGYDRLQQYIIQLGSEEHEFKWLVIDTADKLQPLIMSKVCSERGWADIEEPGFGKGYIAFESKVSEFIRALNWLRKTKNMGIIILSHLEISRFNEPGTEGYDRYNIRLHKKFSNQIIDDVDAVLFMNQQKVIKESDAGFNKKHVHAEGHGTRIIYTEERPGFVSKNRYNMPPQITIPKGSGFASIAKHFPGPFNETNGTVEVKTGTTSGEKPPHLTA